MPSRPEATPARWPRARRAAVAGGWFMAAQHRGTGQAAAPRAACHARGRRPASFQQQARRAEGDQQPHHHRHDAQCLQRGRHLAEDRDGQQRRGAGHHRAEEGGAAGAQQGGRAAVGQHGHQPGAQPLRQHLQRQHAGAGLRQPAQVGQRQVGWREQQEGQHQHDDGDAQRIHLPAPRQRAESAPAEAGHGEEQVTEQRGAAFAMQQAVAAHEEQAQQHEAGADQALARQPLLPQPGRQAHAGEHLPRWGDDRAMGQRREREAGHEQQRKARSGQQREDQAAAPADAGQVAPAPAPHQRQREQRAGRKAQQAHVGRAQARRDAQSGQHRIHGPDGRGQQAPAQARHRGAGGGILRAGDHGPAGAQPGSGAQRPLRPRPPP
jgi:hypothetical protein